MVENAKQKALEVHRRLTGQGEAPPHVVALTLPRMWSTYPYPYPHPHPHPHPYP